MWVCFEAKENFGLEQTEFQSIVSGEPMSIPVKHKDPVFTTWKAPGLMCGNVLPGWVNAQGSISRRVILTDFTEGITGGDPTLPKQLADQTAALLIKCNRAYNWATYNYGDKLIWASLPKYFHEKQAQMEMETDSLFYFVMANEMLERDPFGDGNMIDNDNADADYRVSFPTFEKLYNEWCKGKQRKLVNLTDRNNLRHTLNRAKLAIRHENYKIGNVDCTGWWILGIRRRATTTMDLEDMHITANSTILSHFPTVGAPPPQH